MKKTYSIPAAKVMRMAAAHPFLAVSGGMTIGADAIGIDGSVPSGENPGLAL